MKDDNGNPIKVGDVLRCVYGYSVMVVKCNTGFYGKLVCGHKHPCKNIPYHLNNGKGHIIKAL